MYIKMFESFKDEMKDEKDRYEQACIDREVNTRNIIEKYKSILDEMTQSLRDKYNVGKKFGYRSGSFYIANKENAGEGFTYGLALKLSDSSDFLGEITSLGERVNRRFPREFLIKYMDKTKGGESYGCITIDEFKNHLKRQDFIYKNIDPLDDHELHIQIRIVPR